MDNRYLYHILFNLSRLTRMNVGVARRMFKRSLPYAIRVARRFDDEFPIFFNVHTLEIVRDESKPGGGGERDVAGLYALVMIQPRSCSAGEHLREAKKAADKLCNVGFKLAYQMNTTGFAAEALLRLYVSTGEQRYLEDSYVCLAKMFETCGFGKRAMAMLAITPRSSACFPYGRRPMWRRTKSWRRLPSSTNT